MKKVRWRVKILLLNIRLMTAFRNNHQPLAREPSRRRTIKLFKMRSGVKIANLKLKM
jgi:hypothetical protein